MKRQVVAVFENIRSVENVGAMFRTADALGTEKLYLVGTTPAPVDRFGRIRRDMAKASLGAEETVPWEKVSRIESLLTRLKKEGFQIIAIEQSKSSRDYKSVRPKNKVAFIVGNEVAGVSEKALKTANVIAEIPQHGTKESLNVATSFGIATFRILDI